jgi:pimeloyl-ACP methyl ester carboxylesterase
MKYALFIGAAVFIALLLWLWQPDLPRTELETRYAHGEAEFMRVAGMRLHVRVSGPGNAPVLIMLHGFGDSLQTWEPWANLLNAYRIVRFDLPGFALSGPDPTGDYSDARSQQVLLALMDALHIEQAVLIGHSMGGRIAWRFAASHPERVSKLVLISPDGFASPDFEYGKPSKVPAVMQLMRFALPRSMVRKNLAIGYANPSLISDQLADRYYDLMLAPGVRDAMLKRMQQTILAYPPPLLASIRVPVLLLWGEQDGMIPFANSADYVKALPHCTLVALPGLGHLPHQEAPTTSVLPLKQFLGSDNATTISAMDTAK